MSADGGPPSVHVAVTAPPAPPAAGRTRHRVAGHGLQGCRHIVNPRLPGGAQSGVAWHRAVFRDGEVRANFISPIPGQVTPVTVVFAAPMLSDIAMRMVEAAAGLPGVRLAVVTHDPAESLRHLQGSVAHWRVADILDVEQLVWATRELGARHGPVDFLSALTLRCRWPWRGGVRHPGCRCRRRQLPRQGADEDASGPADFCARHRLAPGMDDAVAFAELSGFPVVVKPQAGAGALQTYRVENMDQLRRALAVQPPSMARPVLLEEFVRGEEHSFETISIDGHAVWHSLTHYWPTPLHVLENPWIQWCLVLPREVDSARYDDTAPRARARC